GRRPARSVRAVARHAADGAGREVVIRIGQGRAPDRGAARRRLRLAAIDAGLSDLEREGSEGCARPGERGAGTVQGAGVEYGQPRPAQAREAGAGSGLDAGGPSEGGDGGEAVEGFCKFCKREKAGREGDSRPAFYALRCGEFIG